MEGMSLLDWLLANWGTTVMVIIGGVITITSAIVKVTPTQVDDGIWFKVLKFLELLSLNNTPVNKRPDDGSN